MRQRARANGSDDVPAISDVAVRAFGVVRTADKLLVRFRDHEGGGPQEIELSWFARRPELAEPLADYLAKWGADKARATRAALPKRLRPFWRFLDERLVDDEAEILFKLADINSALVADYARWLNDQSLEHDWLRKGPSLTSKSVRQQRYSALLALIGHIRSSPRYADDVAEVHARRNPWPLRHRETTSRAAISHVDLRAIRAACVADVTRTLEKLARGRAALAEVVPDLPPAGTASATPFRDIRIVLRTLVARYAGRIPSRMELKRSDPGLARALNDPYHSTQDVGEHLHFTARALVPFVVLIAIDGVFNAEGLLTMKWSAVERSHPIFGEDRWTLALEKRRAGKTHRRSFAARPTAIDSVPNLLRALETYSDLARPHLPPAVADRVLTFWQNRGKPFSVFHGSTSATEDGAWTRSLAAFVAQHDLPDFTLSMLRVSAADVVDEIAGGDTKAKQIMLGHASATTTDRHYKTTTGRVRAQEALATAMAWRERFIASGGRSDSRGGRLLEGRMTAATPGFGCFEPMYSPLSNQRDGRACDAYGQCPACPLAWVDVSNPRAAGRLRQVRELVAHARNDVHPERWLEIWAPQFRALDEIWLPRFSREVAEAADAIPLPPLPAME